MTETLINRISKHVSTVVLSTGVVIYYILSDHEWVNSLLPENGKPLVIFMLVSIVMLHEQVKKISRQMTVHAVTVSVDGLYRQYLVSDNEFIRDEATIQEIDETYDQLKKLGMNSYRQKKIEFLSSKIERYQN